ncbi:MAG: flagellar basal body rod C-terminal domain-containing protein, partial [Mariprofundaceae bacterium]
SIESTFGSLQSTGLSAAMDNFFSAAQQMANAPQDLAQKLNMRNKSEVVATQLSNMSQQLTAAQTSADTKINQDIQSANALLQQVASLNSQIRQHEGTGQGLIGAANDLRDQRDQAIRDLSTILPVQNVSTGDGSVLLQSEGGDLLVQDGTARQLGRSTASTVNGFQDIVIAGTSQVVAGLGNNGSIGGSITMRDGRLAGYLNDLDSIAVNMGFAINQANASGVGSSKASQVSSNLGAIDPALNIDNVIQANPYAAQIQNGSFTMHVYDAAGVPLSQATINITAGAAGSTMNSIAADITANVPGVSASVDISGKLLINAGTNSVGFANDSSNFLAAYQVNSLFQGNSAASFKVSDAVKADAGLISTGSIDAVTSAIQLGDNSSALKFINIQNQALSIDGTAATSLSIRTSLLSTTYGNDVALSVQQTNFHKAEADSLNQQRQAFSGVNIDEELVSMIKFQRAYEASAKVIQTSNQMLNTLMGLIR